MTVRLFCGDGSFVRVRNDYFEKSIFNNPEIAGTRSYTLKCKVRPVILNALLDYIEDGADKDIITDDNFNELQSLCKELGFSGLDKQFRAFQPKTGNISLYVKELLMLKERVTRQDKLLTEIQRQLSEVLNWSERQNPCPARNSSLWKEKLMK